MDRADDPGVLSLQAYDSQAWQVYLRLRHIGINFRVFQINYPELKRLLHQISSSDQFDYVWNLVDTASLERVLVEITRLMHNLLASAKTLVDHTRHLVSDSYRDSEFMKEYQHEVGSRFTTNNLSQFVEGLRNYALHYSLPFPRADMEYRVDPATGDATLTKRFVLEKSTLLKWDGW